MPTRSRIAEQDLSVYLFTHSGKHSRAHDCTQVQAIPVLPILGGYDEVQELYDKLTQYLRFNKLNDVMMGDMTRSNKAIYNWLLEDAKEGRRIRKGEDDLVGALGNLGLKESDKQKVAGLAEMLGSLEIADED